MKVWLENSGIEPKRQNDMVVIFGDGRCLPEDIKKMAELDIQQKSFDRFSIARSYQRLGHINHWGMVDSRLNEWWAKNGKFRWTNDPQRHTVGENDGYEFNWQASPNVFDAENDKWYGSSALFAALACISMGYERIILAGCPLDNEGHWYALPGEESGALWDEEDYRAWKAFSETLDSLQVRSMSGFTAETLGVPDNKWLE